MALFKKGDEVCFVYEKQILAGIVKTIGLLIGIKVQSGEILYASEQYVAPIDAKFCVVETDPEYSNYSKIRLDYTTYTTRNKTWNNWRNQSSWIKESFDPVELCLKTTVYGLEI
ncbi:hypothetical protein pEaSNUABM50_00524 [Erwinia phage pEa_SNUABM_50]|uniref:Uncharacterized protein n=4 Tax=Eneladusvirus BF TaxID=2560751 RepID=A0A7L8ZND3_9CAUD|nr:hypothetical protein FDH34_gp420 [Serratia phage BF]QOI71449.1 hypothetical protein pEaSNUABM12_00532 [Erwinia phage pEa_SNUABM_12]QOI71974.1 hypothetical protein pEaSNUABM47_00525 [Erwinia phage pEa_SNUABM_47]QOI72514.1 hypothetical protein pEaSNUABM50_00524 [Erwinia phage pEa_SNUABM_50]QXO11645.1 hypothetical protein pEaSNUABM19_00534 [Erwinia phage pEa_SNUABM_19]AQW89025.1 hypothetical protein BF_0500 [Serratia phage BF]